MLTPHFLDTGQHAFSVAERRVIEDICAASESDIRQRLPGLPLLVHLLVEPGSAVISETGEVGFTMAAHLIKWTVDPNRDVAQIATDHLRHMLFHECHHAARLVRFPDETYMRTWASGAMFEGLATVFEREAGAFEPPWGVYDSSVVEAWAEELFQQPMDDSWTQWKFDHPDGRRWIAYRVGTWMAERAEAASGRSASDLVWEPMASLLEMAGHQEASM